MLTMQATKTPRWDRLPEELKTLIAMQCDTAQDLLHCEQMFWPIHRPQDRKWIGNPKLWDDLLRGVFRGISPPVAKTLQKRGHDGHKQMKAGSVGEDMVCAQIHTVHEPYSGNRADAHMFNVGIDLAILSGFQIYEMQRTGLAFLMQFAPKSPLTLQLTTMARDCAMQEAASGRPTRGDCAPYMEDIFAEYGVETGYQLFTDPLSSAA